MRKTDTPLLPLLISVVLAACGGSAVLLTSVDGGTDATGGGPDGTGGPDATGGPDRAVGDDGSALGSDSPPDDQFSGNDGSGQGDAGPDSPPSAECVPPDAAPFWEGGCPDGGAPFGGCPTGTICVAESFANQNILLGCAPIPASCTGSPTCACMGTCACGGWACGDVTYGIDCNNGTVSRRAYKRDIEYVADEERASLAREALEIPLARYRYKSEPDNARRRLGFLIDDQPDPSPAVDTDRTHVDLYGYTSLLLATVQEQAKEIDELRLRLRRLEERAESKP